jgi:hypothetical protein
MDFREIWYWGGILEKKKLSSHFSLHLDETTSMANLHEDHHFSLQTLYYSTVHGAYEYDITAMRRSPNNTQNQTLDTIY